ncbi:MAG: 50S ribosomal protein L18 [Minisyncoccia bacterium]
MNKSLTTKSELRTRRHARVRSRISGTETCPRLAVFKSNRFVSAQVIDDTKGTTLASAHGREFKGTMTVQAAAVGREIAKRAKEKGISKIVFDRGGYAYTSQIKALADAAREGGLTF